MIQICYQNVTDACSSPCLFIIFVTLLILLTHVLSKEFHLIALNRTVSSELNELVALLCLTFEIGLSRVPQQAIASTYFDLSHIWYAHKATTAQTISMPLNRDAMKRNTLMYIFYNMV